MSNTAVDIRTIEELDFTPDRLCDAQWRTLFGVEILCGPAKATHWIQVMTTRETFEGGFVCTECLHRAHEYGQVLEERPL